MSTALQRRQLHASGLCAGSARNPSSSTWQQIAPTTYPSLAGAASLCRKFCRRSHRHMSSCGLRSGSRRSLNSCLPNDASGSSGAKFAGSPKLH